MVYRDVFRDLLTREAAGTIVPEVATAWRYQRSILNPGKVV